MLNAIALAIFSLAILIPGRSTQSGQSAGCPTETARARATLARYLTGPLYAEERARYGIPQFAPGSVRVLADSTDADVCAEFNRSIGSGRFGRDPYRLNYFAAPGYYFVTINMERTPGGPIRAGHHPPVIVLDRSLRAVNLSVIEP